MQVSRPLDGQGQERARFRRTPYVRARPGAAAAESQRLQVTALGLLTFVCGALAHLKVNLVGEIYVGEILLVIAGVAAAASGGLRRAFSNRAFLLLLLAAIVTLCGYMLSDFMRGTAQAQYIRGWARTGFIITSFSALAMLFLADKRNVWWFLLGIGIGGLVYFKLVERLPLFAHHHWKFSYSVPLTLFFASLAAFLPIRLVAGLFLALGTYSMFSDFRIHGAVCLLVAMLLWAVGSQFAHRIRPGTIVKVGVLGAFGLVLAFQVLSLTENDWTEQRRGSSDFTREAGVRFGLHAISESPLIGYGSWANSPTLAAIANQEIRAQEARSGMNSPIELGRGMHTHSQILQGWVEGGIFGAALFLVMALMLPITLAFTILKRPGDMLTPALLFVLSFQLWHLFASPLGSNVRLFFALAMALIVLASFEKANLRLVRPSGSRTRGFRSGKK